MDICLEISLNIGLKVSPPGITANCEQLVLITSMVMTAEGAQKTIFTLPLK